MTDGADPTEAKRALRKQAAARRDAAAGIAGEAGARLTETLLGADILPAGAAVSGFWPIGSEIDSRPLLRALAARGHVVALPVVVGRDRPLVFRAWAEDDAMAEGPWGIREPLESAAEVRPRVLFVPLLAFDRDGYRLGYGGGFYDRSIARLRAAGPVLAIGLAWAAQEVPAVPHDALDEPLDWVLTERELFRTGAGGPA